jgi:putative endonuclease
MFWVYILQGNSGRHYIGMTDDLRRRLAEHSRGHTHTTKRLGGDLRLVARREFPTRVEAAAFERKLKSWKNPAKAVAALRAEPVESSSPDPSGLVAGSTPAPGTSFPRIHSILRRSIWVAKRHEKSGRCNGVPIAPMGAPTAAAKPINDFCAFLRPFLL